MLTKRRKWIIGTVIAAVVALTGVIALVVNACQGAETLKVTKRTAACDDADDAERLADRSRSAYVMVLQARRERGASVSAEKEQALEDADARYREGKRLLVTRECDKASDEFEDALTIVQDACPLSYDPKCVEVSNIDPGT